MNKLAQKIEFASHIAIIIVATLISVVLVKNYLLPDSKTKSSTSNNTAVASNTGEAGVVGKAISLPDTNWKRSDQTLVLVLSTGCHFCTESASFYKELVQKRAKQENTRLVAVLPQPVDAGSKYLSNLGIAVDDVRQLAPNSLGVRGTPTLLLVNKEGVVTNAWLGKLPPTKEAEVLSRLKRE
jgi:thioredoxin-related protein